MPPDEELSPRTLPERHAEVLRRWLTLEPSDADYVIEVERLARAFCDLNRQGLRMGPALHRLMLRRGMFLLSDQEAVPALQELYKLLDLVVGYLHQEIEPATIHPTDL